MKTKHTPAPWRYQSAPKHQHAIDRKWEIVAPLDGGGQLVIVGEHTGVDCLTEPDAQRITACVNACSQFEDPAEAIRLLGTEAAKVPALLTERDALRQQVAELAAALDFIAGNSEQMAKSDSADRGLWRACAKQARAALAKVRE